MGRLLTEEFWIARRCEKARLAYYTHRHNARKRGIEWRFTFSAWMYWWVQDDRWLRRGCHKGELVMAHRKDKGPYSPNNVVAMTPGENKRDIPKAVRRATLKKT